MELALQSFVLWFLWPAILGVVFYWYFTRNHDYWKKLGIPSAPTVPVLGSTYKMFTKPMQESEMEKYRKYGRIYGHYEGSRPVLNIAEPELLRNILVKDFQFFVNRRSIVVGDPITDNMLGIMEGEKWKRIRSIITPTFTTGKIRRMLSIFKDCAKVLHQNFTAAAKEGKTVECKRLFSAFTLDVIASAAFSTKIDSLNDPNNKFMITARKIFTQKISWRFVLFFLSPKLMSTFRINIFSPSVMNFFKTITVQIIQERKKSGQVRNDFLQLMLDIAKEEISKEEETESKDDKEADLDSNYATDENNDVLKQYLHKKSLSYDEMVAQSVGFLLAGFDTTAATMSFVCYTLCLNPDIQEKVIEDIDQAVNEAGGEITYEAIHRMKYLDNVISETLRLYPPAIRVERRAGEDYKLGDTGITIPKDMIVGIPIYAMHRDPEFFPDPEKFDPERFSPEAKESRNSYTYLPFGAGPRNCVGMRFALMEIKVCLAYVFSHFRVRRCPETIVPIKVYMGGAGSLQSNAINVKMELRTDGVLKL